MRRFHALVLVALATLVLTIPAGAATTKKLFGTVGPGFTISLKRFGKPLKTLQAGTYSITVWDRSNIHNFHLRGPGVNNEITQIGFKGFKTVVVKLTKGAYSFICDPHFTTMKGTLEVG
jgi:plastocyanin